MFIPKICQSEDQELIKKIISENAFALLILDNEKLSATHSLLLLNKNNGNTFLETYISKANL